MSGKMPAWFQAARVEVYKPVSVLNHRKFRVHFVDRTLKGIAGILEGFVFSESYVHKSGLLQGLEARLKLVGVLVFIVCTSLVHSIPCLYGLYGLTLILAVLSKIPGSFFLRRVWLVLPFFVGVIALPATLNLFTPGETFFTLFSLDRTYQAGPYLIPRDISVTRQGISAALLLVGRVATSLSFVLLLILTTPWASLLKALRSLLVPQIYVQTLGMTMRYLLLLAGIVQDMCLAKKSRTLRTGRAAEEQRWVAGQLGTLFKWSMQLSGEVYRSMVARGYNGETRTLTSSPPRIRDYAWLTFCAGAAGILLYVGR
jgi:cobalt/nickel transport system permease protein